MLLFWGQNSFSQKSRNKVSDKVQAEELFVEGMKYDMLEQYSKAIDFFEKSKNLNPENAAIHFKLADCYGRLNKLDEALVNAELALELNPDQIVYYRL